MWVTQWLQASVWWFYYWITSYSTGFTGVDLDHWVSLDQEGFPVRSSVDSGEWCRRKVWQLISLTSETCAVGTDVWSPLVVFVWRKWRSAGELLLCGGSGWWRDKPSPLLLPRFPSLPGFDWFLLLSGCILILHKPFLQEQFLSAGLQEAEWALFLFIILSCSKHNKSRLSSPGPSELKQRIAARLSVVLNYLHISFPPRNHLSLKNSWTALRVIKKEVAVQTGGWRESWGRKDAERWRVGEIKWDMERNKGRREKTAQRVTQEKELEEEVKWAVDGRRQPDKGGAGGTPDGFHQAVFMQSCDLLLKTAWLKNWKLETILKYHKDVFLFLRTSGNGSEV